MRDGLLSPGRVLGQADPVVRDALLAELPSPEPARTVTLLRLLRRQLPADRWAELVLAHGAEVPEALADLPVLLGCTDLSGRGVPAGADLPALVEAWRRLLDRERAALERDGSVPIVPGVTDPALLWPKVSCVLRSGDLWP